MNIILVSLVVAVFQILTGFVSARAAKIAKQNQSDILAEITVGKGSIKFDKSDILAVAFAIFVFWGVKNAGLDTQQSLTAFTVVLTGSGVKELIQAFFPTTAT